MSVDYLSSLNVGSGLNTTQIIDSLVAAEQIPQENLINNKKDEATVSISSFGTVKQDFTSLGNTLSSVEGIIGMSIDVNSSAIDVEISDSAKISEFSNIIEVDQIAAAQTLVYDGFASEGADVGAGSITFEFGTWSNGSFTKNNDAIGGTIEITADAASLTEVKDSINSAQIGVTASIVKKSDVNYALVLKAGEGSENAMRISTAEGPSDSNIYYLTNYDTKGEKSFHPGNGLSVSQTTAGILNTTQEIQSVAGFSSSEISQLSGKTLFFHDGTNTLSVSFDSAPADVDGVVSAITSASGYADMDFAVSAGSETIILTYAASEGDVELANVGFLGATETVSAKDANLSIDGVSISRASNSISDLIEGVTLTISDVTTSAETISGTWDNDSALLALQTFVTQLNTSISSLKTLTDRGSTTSDPGSLAGDPLANYLLTNLSRLTTQPIVGFGQNPVYLANFGVTTELDGTITIDEDKFESYFSENPAEFGAITTSRVDTNTGLVSGEISGNDYIAGTYSFEIDSNTGLGTIDSDISLTKSGSSYIALTGDLAGLSLSTGTGASSATIFVGRSLLETVQDFASEMLTTNGEIDDKLTLLNEEVTDYDLQLLDISAKMESLRSRYVSQYAAMDSVVAQLKSTETAITQMMDAWRASLET